MARATARKTNIIDESFDRVQRAFDSANEEIEKLQERAQKNARKAQDRLLEIPAFKKADDLRKKMRKRAESNVDDFMKVLPVATESDIKKINLKLNQINRKLKAIEKAQAELS